MDNPCCCPPSLRNRRCLLSVWVLRRLALTHHKTIIHDVSFVSPMHQLCILHPGLCLQTCWTQNCAVQVFCVQVFDFSVVSVIAEVISGRLLRTTVIWTSSILDKVGWEVRLLCLSCLMSPRFGWLLNCKPKNSTYSWQRTARCFTHLGLWSPFRITLSQDIQYSDMSANLNDGQ